MAYKTNKELAELMRDLAERVERGEGKALGLMYVDENSDVHTLRSVEVGCEIRAAHECNALARAFCSGHDHRQSIGRFGYTLTETPDPVVADRVDLSEESVD
jgi:hypothetical protein